MELIACTWLGFGRQVMESKEGACAGSCVHVVC